MSPDSAALSTDACTLPDGRTLAYATGGDPDGRPVVVHHGTPGSRLFGALLSGTAAEVGVRILVPDRPGYGRSSPPSEEWSWEEWGDDVGELLDAESVEQAGSLGFSGGGPFALAAASDDRVARVGLVSAVVPPAENALATLASVPFALRAVFRVSKTVASVSGPSAVVSQYTDRSVSDAVADAVAADFHEALAPGAAAVERENRAFASASLDPDLPDTPICAWHGTTDENTPLPPVRALVRERGGTLETVEADHLGTLLDCQRAALEWAGGAE
ncbi:pimeloyl-ACP methyl ester carboxylesterase [Halorubrum trapanicum]|uniref:Pimeloyl-ACP methyl ester carboxylesterase n=1 Tax=Halorubrum trapanicum TaxID=29284 RepID=A0A8J7R655_9EURY|nr:alpha/beta hydrolase [Halorubrum trapanicum]MBP1901206.1 pimeloyl-ACP methyl ester carboxylesterase [Halorubrum trapanicum]